MKKMAWERMKKRRRKSRSIAVHRENINQKELRKRIYDWLILHMIGSFYRQYSLLLFLELLYTDNSAGQTIYYKLFASYIIYIQSTCIQPKNTCPQQNVVLQFVDFFYCFFVR